MYDANNGSERGSDRRISLSAARRMLGMIARNYSDTDIEEILDVLYGIAEEGYEEYRNENKSDSSGQ